MAVSKEDILEAISNMSVMDVVALVKSMEEKFGVSAASVAVAAAPAAAAAAVEEKTEFDAAHNKQKTIKVNQKQSETTFLQEKIKSHQLQMAELEKQIREFQIKIDNADKEIEEARQKIQDTKVRFEETYTHFESVLKSDIDTFNKYL